MPQPTENEEIFEGIDFPHNAWRRLDDKKTPIAKARALVYIHRLKKAGLPVSEIQAMISELYWDAFVEHELQIKEKTGKSVQEFIATQPVAAGV
jgi:phenylalanine-4-hydroxylase